MDTKGNGFSRDALIGKVKKLLAVADPSSNAFESEMENAIRLAKKLMADNDISMMEVDAVGGKREVVFEFNTKDAHEGNLAGWELYMAPIVENLCGTKAIRRRSYGGKSIIVFCGTATDVAVSVEMYKVLNKMVRGRARAFVDPSENHTAYRSYAEGFVMILYRKSAEEVVYENQKTQETHALVVIQKKTLLNKWMEEVMNVRKTHARRRHIDESAYYRGIADGKDVSLRVKGVLK